MIFTSNKKIVKRFREACFDKLPRKERKLLWKRIEASIESPNIKRVSRPNYSLYLRIAASIAILVISGYFLLKNHTTSSDSAELCIYETKQKERIHLILPDSSEVWLNAGSRIEYPSSFSSATRTVRLDGEAYFNVRPDKGKKFTVQTGNTRLNVLGTSFVVSNYPNGETSEVILVSGRVNVLVEENSFSEAHDLQANEKWVYDKVNHRINISQVDASIYTKWIDGQLNFDNAELARIAAAIGHWYGVHFVYKPEIGTRYHLTLTVRDESLQHTLQMMQNIAPILFVQSNDTIEIIEKKSK